MKIEEIIAELAKIRPDSTFLKVNGYKSVKTSEVSDFQIVFHMSYANALEKAILDLECVVPENELQAEAKDSLMKGYKKSFDKVSSEPLEVIGEHYRRVFDSNGNHIKGIKVHNETNTLYIFGRLHKKKVRSPGNYKTVNHKPLTIAKDELSKNFAVSKFRQFVIEPGQFESIKVENLTLTLDDE